MTVVRCLLNVIPKRYSKADHKLNLTDFSSVQFQYVDFLNNGARKISLHISSYCGNQRVKVYSTLAFEDCLLNFALIGKLEV